MALTFGFDKLVARRGGLCLLLLVLDKLLTILDNKGREQVRVLLRRMVRPDDGSGRGLLGLRYSTILVIQTKIIFWITKSYVKKILTGYCL